MEWPAATDNKLKQEHSEDNKHDGTTQHRLQTVFKHSGMIHTHTAGGGKLMTFWMWFSVMEAKKGQCEMSKRKNADFLIPLNS